MARTERPTVSVEVETRIVGGDARPTGLEKVVLELAQTRISVADLIRRAVEEQVWELLSKRRVEASEARESLDRLYLTAQSGTTPPPHRTPKVNVEGAVRDALEAFAQGTYLVLVDGKQVANPQEEVTLAQASRVTFLRLTPLAGG